MSALAMILAAAMAVPGDEPENESGEIVQEWKPNTLQIRQYPKDGQPWNSGEAILVRLNIARLRAYSLSSEDVMKAFGESTVLGSRRRVDPPPGVVFNMRLWRPEQYEQLIVRATPDGEIVRLKDVAKVELGR